jgi:hypothetical protein
VTVSESFGEQVEEPEEPAVENIIKKKNSKCVLPVSRALQTYCLQTYTIVQVFQLPDAQCELATGIPLPPLYFLPMQCMPLASSSMKPYAASLGVLQIKLRYISQNI